MDFNSRLSSYENMVNQGLQKYLPSGQAFQKDVFDAMRYSVMAGGKRIRPVLVLEFCRVCGGNIEDVVPFACAMEFVHTYSLIHDDLPCMDDDSIRRGKPSCHVKFGYATALLAGDALLSLAFETALCNNIISSFGPKNVTRATKELADASGAFGMVGGQVIDLESEGCEINLEKLETMHKLKTGAMITAAAKIGCILAGAEEKVIASAGSFADKIGLAFQITDDILDAIGDSKKLGKPIGSDESSKKSTYVTDLGLSKSKELVQNLTSDAIEQLSVFGGKADFLNELAKRLALRDK